MKTETESEGAAVEPVEVPYKELSADALNGVVESFVLREGTDYGAVESSMAEKVAAVKSQLEAGTAAILYDPETRSITLIERSSNKIR